MDLIARLLAIAALALSPTCAQAQDCVACVGAQVADKPLVFEITSDLAFSRMALTGQGEASAVIDAQQGTRQVSGDAVALGGLAVQGRGRITGTPNRRVRVDLPRSVTMTSADGGSAVLTDFTTDLPPWPVLDSTGTLEFAFGGRLQMRGNLTGSLRGRIPITVDYN